MRKIVELGLQSFRAPRRSLAEILSWSLAPRVIWQAAVAILIFSFLLSRIGLALFPLSGEMGGMVQALFASPVFLLLVQLGLILCLSGALRLAGRLFGGAASWPDCLTAVVWLNFLSLLMQALQLALMFVSPMLAGLASFASFFALLALATGFTMELQGYKNALVTLIGIILGFILCVVIVSSLIAPFL